MDGDESHIQRRRRAHGMGNSLRNVVKFQIEKDVDPLPPQGANEVGPLPGEELHADLEEAQVRLEPPYERKGVRRGVHVESENEFVGHGPAGFTRAVKQAAPAKINLYLHITGRRPDGFHELETLMVPISLGDTLEIELDETAKEIAFTCSDPMLADVKDNLATKAARLFLDEFELATGVRIHLEKKVPVGAGLGGGSSDAAAVLLALRELTGVDADDAKLRELAARLGSDIPFFIPGTPAICRGRGEIIDPVTLRESYQGLLVHPGFGVSTPWAYKTYAQNPRTGEPGGAFADFTLRNDLEPPAFSKYAWLPVTKRWFQEQPEVLDALMSGSGSSVFALTPTAEAAVALRGKFHAEFGADLFSTPFHVIAPA